MSPNQQSTYIQNYPNISSPPDDTIVIAGSALTITKVPKLPVVIPPILPKVITGAITSRVINRYEAQYNAFRFAFDGKIPGLPPEEHVFTETGISLAGRFLEYWNTHGGLAQQGFPITPPLTEISDLDGKPYTVQYFERAVFEYHPNNVGTLYDVLLSQLGSLQYREKYPNGALGQIPNPNNPGFFPQTGHTLGGRFRDYWNNNGGLAQFGYPISEEFTEISDLDNKPYIVQYFERAVFEYHPENNIPFDTLLSQLGTLRYHQKYNVKTFKLTP
jgi:hypothetical protein